MSTGQVQIFNATVEEINRALQQLTEPSTTSGSGGTASAIAIRSQVVFLAPPVGLAVIAPGVNLVELSTGLRRVLNFYGGAMTKARIWCFGSGSESGNKTVKVITTEGTVLASLSWTGTSEALRIGSISSFSITEDTLLQLHVSGSTATENLVLKSLVVAFGN